MCFVAAQVSSFLDPILVKFCLKLVGAFATSLAVSSACQRPIL